MPIVSIKVGDRVVKFPMLDLDKVFEKNDSKPVKLPINFYTQYEP